MNIYLILFFEMLFQNNLEHPCVCSFQVLDILCKVNNIKLKI